MGYAISSVCCSACFSSRESCHYLPSPWWGRWREAPDEGADRKHIQTGFMTAHFRVKIFR